MLGDDWLGLMRALDGRLRLACGRLSLEALFDLGRIHPTDFLGLVIYPGNRHHRLQVRRVFMLLNAAVWANFPAKINQLAAVVAGIAQLRVAVRADLPVVVDKVVAGRANR